MSKEMHEMRALLYVVWPQFLHLPPPCKAYLGRASNYHTERRKTKREDREVTIEAMLADGG
jgi:hypothetical protein